jgi:hypothetical protein
MCRLALVCVYVCACVYELCVYVCVRVLNLVNKSDFRATTVAPC